MQRAYLKGMPVAALLARYPPLASGRPKAPGSRVGLLAADALGQVGRELAGGGDGTRAVLRAAEGADEG